MNIRQIAMPQYTHLQVKTAVFRTFLPFLAQVLPTQTSHTASGPTSTSSTRARPKKVSTDFWVFDEETGEEGFTGLYTENEFWVLSAKGSYSKRRIYGRSFKKGRPKGYGKKGGKKIKTRLPPEVKRQRFLQHGKMTSKTQLSGEKARAKEKVKRARKE